jgi:hypothetical protein
MFSCLTPLISRAQEAPDDTGWGEVQQSLESKNPEKERIFIKCIYIILNIA